MAVQASSILDSRLGPDAPKTICEQGPQHGRGFVISSECDQTLASVARRKETVLIAQPARASARVHHRHHAANVDRVLAQAGQRGVRACSSADHHNTRLIDADADGVHRAQSGGVGRECY